ncbi:prosaposin-like [Polypterus senegalus]|nr:prosaposin-like [Polypterus senegalus]
MTSQSVARHLKEFLASSTWEKMSQMKVSSLEQKRIHEDQIQVFKILKGIDKKPDSACATIGLCKSENPGIENSELLTNDIFDSAVPTATGSTKLQPLCTLCIFLLNRLESLIPKKRAEDTIIKFLNKVCSSMPRYTAQCKIFVTTYGKVAVDFLLSSMAPQTICTLLRLCFIQQTGLLQVNSESDCALCHSLVPSLQVSLSDNATALETEATLSSACYSHQLPLPTCKNFVQTYSPKLVKVTGKKWDFQTVCKEIEACSEADITPHLENSECTWGPTYWCLDLQTAKQCNAVEHCQSHVWK